MRVGLARTLAWAEAFKVLAHEAVHISGQSDEAAAECTAMQLVAPTARKLGVPAARARLFTATVWSAYGLMPPLYRTSLCVDGGPFDLHPESSRWP